MSLPRLPRHTLHFKAIEKNWYRWEPRITFVGYTLCMAIILILNDHGALPRVTCMDSEKSILKYENSFVLVLTCGITVLGMINLIILEGFLKWGAHLLFQ